MGPRYPRMRAGGGGFLTAGPARGGGGVWGGRAGRPVGRVLRRAAGSDGEPPPPLEDAALEDGAAVARSVPGHEAMPALAAPLLGLVGSLGHKAPPKGNKTAPRHGRGTAQLYASPTPRSNTITLH